MWWNGDGAARVLAQDEEALLLERAMGATSLADMARNGCDDDASRIICAVIARLHAKRDCPPQNSSRCRGGLNRWSRRRSRMAVY
jgi:streptomycin 6-kinase